MNSENKTPQEELLEEVKNAEAAAEEAKAKETQSTPQEKEDSEAESKTEAEKADSKKKEKPGRHKSGRKGLKELFATRKFKRGGMATVFTAVFIVVIILVNVVVSLLSDRFPSMNLDLTANKVNTLSEEALEVAKDVSYDTTIYILATDDWIDYASSYGYPYSTLISLSDKLAEANSKITVEQIDLEKNPTFANEYASDNVSNGYVIVQSEKRYRVLSYNDLFPTQTNSQTGSSSLYNNVDSSLATALKQVNLEEVPLISIATGHNEALSDQISTLTSFFNDNAFDVQEFNIMTEDIPENTRLLLIPTPNTDYTEEELDKLDAYLNNKDSDQTRSIIVSAMPGQATLPNLSAFLEEWGISYDPTSMVLESDTSRILSGNPGYYFSDVDTETAIPSGDYPLLITPYSVPVDILFDSNNGISTYVLSATAETSYLQKTDSEEDASETAEKKSYDTAVLARKSLDSTGTGGYANVILLGSTHMLTYVNQSAFSNASYVTELAKYATDTTNTNNTVYTPSVQTGVQDMTATTAVINFLGLGVFTIAIPVIILLVGLVIFFKRRHL